MEDVSLNPLSGRGRKTWTDARAGCGPGAEDGYYCDKVTNDDSDDQDEMGSLF